ncbi:hypothetical protein K505DRAFT_201597, partial [Melanomma pulvis-pyrius CBS 109.77]
WFIPGDGIAREVITEDIQRYIGPDAVVRPGLGTGEWEGKSGYWWTADRTLTAEMILNIQSDSENWRKEVGTPPNYQDSVIHASRQYWGPTIPHQ